MAFFDNQYTNVTDGLDEIQKQSDELYDTFHIKGILPKGPTLHAYA